MVTDNLSEAIFYWGCVHYSPKRPAHSMAVVKSLPLLKGNGLLGNLYHCCLTKAKYLKSTSSLFCMCKTIYNSVLLMLLYCWWRFVPNKRELLPPLQIIKVAQHSSPGKIWFSLNMSQLVQTLPEPIKHNEPFGLGFPAFAQKRSDFPSALYETLLEILGREKLPKFLWTSTPAIFTKFGHKILLNSEMKFTTKQQQYR